MKKKLLCLLMCIIMVASTILVGCSEIDTGEEESATDTGKGNALTITFYSIKGEGTTDEAVAEVEAAINQITQGKFNTNIELRLYDEDEYADAIFEKVALKEEEIKKEEEEEAARKAAAKAARESAKAAAAAGITTKKQPKATEEEETTEPEDETYINELGRELTVYPESTESQLDIFLVNSLDMLIDLKEKEVVSALDSEISVGAKKLKSYIYPTFLESSKVDGGTYMIPNNHVVGEYTYILLNKELVDKYSYDPTAMTTFEGILDYLDDIINYETDVTPLLNEPEMSIRFWNVEPNEAGTRGYLSDSNEYSMLASYVPGLPEAETKYQPRAVTLITQYQKFLVGMKSLEERGFAPAKELDLNTDKKFGAAFVKGDINTPALYEDDYYISVYKYPLINNNEVFTSGYAIGAYTKDLTRTMEILTYLNTNKEFANILAYGVENVHYTVNEDTGMVELKANSGYNMEMKYAGNQFMLTPNTSMSESMLALAENNWAAAKLQNQDSAPDPYLGFYFTYEEDKVADDGTVTPAKSRPAHEVCVDLRKVGEEYLQKYNEYVPYIDEAKGKLIDLTAYMKGLKKEVNALEAVVEASDAESEYSIVGAYTAWFTAMYPDAQ